MIIEVWEGDNCYTVIKKGGKKDSDCKKKLREIRGRNWNDCMRQHHELMGWEPYKPIK